MLVLERKLGEVIVVDGRLEISVERIGPHSVRLGFSGAKDIKVNRKEVEAKPRNGKG